MTSDFTELFYCCRQTTLGHIDREQFSDGRSSVKTGRQTFRGTRFGGSKNVG